VKEGEYSRVLEHINWSQANYRLRYGMGGSIWSKKLKVHGVGFRGGGTYRRGEYRI
jgi:hypothetical protein